MEGTINFTSEDRKQVFDFIESILRNYQEPVYYEYVRGHITKASAVVRRYITLKCKGEKFLEYFRRRKNYFVVEDTSVSLLKTPCVKRKQENTYEHSELGRGRNKLWKNDKRYRRSLSCSSSARSDCTIESNCQSFGDDDEKLEHEDYANKYFSNLLSRHEKVKLDSIDCDSLPKKVKRHLTLYFKNKVANYFLNFPDTFYIDEEGNVSLCKHTATNCTVPSDFKQETSANDIPLDSKHMEFQVKKTTSSSIDPELQRAIIYLDSIQFFKHILKKKRSPLTVQKVGGYLSQASTDVRMFLKFNYKSFKLFFNDAPYIFSVNSDEEVTLSSVYKKRIECVKKEIEKTKSGSLPVSTLKSRIDSILQPSKSENVHEEVLLPEMKANKFITNEKLNAEYSNLNSQEENKSIFTSLHEVESSHYFKANIAFDKLFCESTTNQQSTRETTSKSNQSRSDQDSCIEYKSEQDCEEMLLKFIFTMELFCLEMTEKELNFFATYQTKAVRHFLQVLDEPFPRFWDITSLQGTLGNAAIEASVFISKKYKGEKFSAFFNEHPEFKLDSQFVTLASSHQEIFSKRLNSLSVYGHQNSKWNLPKLYDSNCFKNFLKETFSFLREVCHFLQHKSKTKLDRLGGIIKSFPNCMEWIKASEGEKLAEKTGNFLHQFLIFEFPIAGYIYFSDSNICRNILKFLQNMHEEFENLKLDTVPFFTFKNDCFISSVDSISLNEKSNINLVELYESVSHELKTVIIDKIHLRYYELAQILPKTSLLEISDTNNDSRIITSALLESGQFLLENGKISLNIPCNSVVIEDNVCNLATENYHNEIECQHETPNTFENTQELVSTEDIVYDANLENDMTSSNTEISSNISKGSSKNTFTDNHDTTAHQDISLNNSDVNWGTHISANSKVLSQQISTNVSSECNALINGYEKDLYFHPRSIFPCNYSHLKNSDIYESNKDLNLEAGDVCGKQSISSFESETSDEENAHAASQEQPTERSSPSRVSVEENLVLSDLSDNCKIPEDPNIVSETVEINKTEIELEIEQWSELLKENTEMWEEYTNVHAGQDTIDTLLGSFKDQNIPFANELNAYETKVNLYDDEKNETISGNENFHYSEIESQRKPIVTNGVGNLYEADTKTLKKLTVIDVLNGVKLHEPNAESHKEQTSIIVLDDMKLPKNELKDGDQNVVCMSDKSETDSLECKKFIPSSNELKFPEGETELSKNNNRKFSSKNIIDNDIHTNKFTSKPYKAKPLECHSDNCMIPENVEIEAVQVTLYQDDQMTKVAREKKSSNNCQIFTSDTDIDGIIETKCKIVEYLSPSDISEMKCQAEVLAEEVFKQMSAFNELRNKFASTDTMFKSKDRDLFIASTNVIFQVKEKEILSTMSNDTESCIHTTEAAPVVITKVSDPVDAFNSSVKNIKQTENTSLSHRNDISFEYPLQPLLAVVVLLTSDSCIAVTEIESRKQNIYFLKCVFTCDDQYCCSDCFNDLRIGDNVSCFVPPSEMSCKLWIAFMVSKEASEHFNEIDLFYETLKKQKKDGKIIHNMCVNSEHISIQTENPSKEDECCQTEMPVDEHGCQTCLSGDVKLCAITEESACQTNKLSVTTTSMQTVNKTNTCQSQTEITYFHQTDAESQTDCTGNVKECVNTIDIFCQTNLTGKVKVLIDTVDTDCQTISTGQVMITKYYHS